MRLEITQAGSFTTIQDSGRYHWAHLGVPVSGFMDKPAAQLANYMVGNDYNQGLFEVTWTGMGFISDINCSIAIAGAEFTCLVNGQQINTDEAIHLQAGDEFKMMRLIQGVRAYVAVAGGLDIPQVGGSVSTLVVAQLGGVSGRQIHVGDRINLRQPSHVLGRSKPAWKKIKGQQIHVIRAMPGPEFDQFSPEAAKQAYGQAYMLSKDCSRQGFRLASTAIKYPKGFHMNSSGLVAGSLQVTPNGQTILAMQDAQTTGGYPRILVVNQAELHKLAQIRPGEQVYFFVESG